MQKAVKMRFRADVKPCTRHGQPVKTFGNLLHSLGREDTSKCIMSSPSPTHSGQRASRIKLTDSTPAVLRFKDGRNTSGKLQVVSVTGGLLSLQRAVHQGATAKLMFLTRKGPVLGAAEMLPPMSSTLQPFRFIALDKDNHRRLHQTVQAELGNAGDATAAAGNCVPEEDWIRKYRAAVTEGGKPEKKLIKMLFGAFTLGAAVFGAKYFFHSKQ